MPDANVGFHASDVRIDAPPATLDPELLSPLTLSVLARVWGDVSPNVRQQRDRDALPRREPLRFDPATRALRAGEWRVAPPPPALTRRTVEITAAPEAKLIIHALQSGADVFMADFEDACAPTFANLVSGQRALWAAAQKNLSYMDPGSGRTYRLERPTAALMMRPRGWHLDEAHVTVGGQVIAGAVFDLTLYCMHTGAELRRQGRPVAVYLPKIASVGHAELWEQTLRSIETALGWEPASVRATALVETHPAVFLLDEIAHALKSRLLGFNLGRWDYILSAIKEHATDPHWITPDRSALRMDQPFLRAAAQRVLQVCRRRGLQAIGGMAAQVPGAHPELARAAEAAVLADKQREAAEGFVGTWVAHPGLVTLARQAMTQEKIPAAMAGPEFPLAAMPPSTEAAEKMWAEALTRPPAGPRTVAELEHTLRIAIHYLASWLAGRGCIAIEGRMEDAATVEITRAQLWQWIHQRAPAEGAGGPSAIDSLLVDRLADNVVAELKTALTGPVETRIDEARDLFMHWVKAPQLAPFFTVEAYPRLVQHSSPMDPTAVGLSAAVPPGPVLQRTPPRPPRS